MNQQDYSNVDIDYNSYELEQDNTIIDNSNNDSIDEKSAFEENSTTTINVNNNTKPTREIIRGSVINEQE